MKLTKDEKILARMPKVMLPTIYKVEKKTGIKNIQIPRLKIKL